jgi:Tfp pilus assembly PilM family ATPase
VEEGAEELVSEVRKALDDYASFPGAGSGFKVVLSGGCSKLPAVSRQLKRQLSVELGFFNPFKGYNA